MSNMSQYHHRWLGDAEEQRPLHPAAASSSSGFYGHQPPTYSSVGTGGHDIESAPSMVEGHLHHHPPHHLHHLHHPHHQPPPRRLYYTVPEPAYYPASSSSPSPSSPAPSSLPPSSSSSSFSSSSPRRRPSPPPPPVLPIPPSSATSASRVSAGVNGGRYPPGAASSPTTTATTATRLLSGGGGGGATSVSIAAPTVYAENPDDLFRSSGAAGGFHPQLMQRVPDDGHESMPLYNGARQRGLPMSGHQQQTEIAEGARVKYIPFFLILASIAQCAMMAIEIWHNGGFVPLSVNPFFGPSAETLIYLGAKWVPEIVKDYQVWRLVTPIFLHAGLIHLALNLVFQLQCFLLERQLGWARVGIIYLVSGFSGNLVSSLFLPQLISVGSSGALFGLVGTIFVVIIRNWSLVVSPCRSLVLLTIMVAISLFTGLLPNVDNFAHVGGLVAGVLVSIAVVPSLKHGSQVGQCGLFVASVSILVLAGSLAFGLYALYEDVPLREWCGFCSMINCVDFGQDWCDHLENP